MAIGDMKARFEDVPWSGKESFMMRSYDLPRFEAPWHFHPEYELTLILEGSGDRCVGDHLEPFESGDLVLLGPDLPHYWHSYARSGGQRARAIVVHFKREAFGAGFFSLPELIAWQNLLGASRRGIHFNTPGLIEEVGELLRGSEASAASRRLLALWEVLDCLAANVGGSRLLAGEHYLPVCDRRTSDRLGRVYQYIYAHLSEPISLEDVATTAGMSPTAFSRYFRRATGRTLMRLINELRVTQVCKQLTENDESITEIAFSAGFQSVSNFNRVFLDIQGLNPQSFRKQYQNRG